ncbi:MAG: hypothetical protein GF317_05980 [Candidatus Lokiarchaeota archaeon]|nr:hypothetical protein [Candidatus Lokiarchaeota archaeon]
MTDPTFGDLALQSLGLFGLSISGVIIKLSYDFAVKWGSKKSTIKWVRNVPNFSSVGIITVIIWLGLGIGILMIVIMIYNALGFSIAQGSILLPYFVFSGISAIGEELAFCSLQSTFWNMLIFSSFFKKRTKSTQAVRMILTNTTFILLFMYFHLVVYQQIEALIFIGILRLIGSTQYQFTRRLSIPILLHLISNFSALMIVPA